MLEYELNKVIKQVEQVCYNEALYKDSVGSLEHDDLCLRFQLFTPRAVKEFLNLNEDWEKIDWGVFVLCEAYLCDEDDCGYYIIHIHIDEDAYEEYMVEQQKILKLLDFRIDADEIVSAEERELIPA